MTQPLPPMPVRIAKLPRDHRGFPIPWFVETLADGTRDFRIADYRKRARAVRTSKCWVCGETLGRHLAFVIGPMCAVNRVTSEPPCHLECAEWSVKACPFLSRPRMQRNLDYSDVPEARDAPGIHLHRNPGVTCIWVTGDYAGFKAGDGWLIRIGRARAVHWYAEGKRCDRARVLESIESGYPLLQEAARLQGQDAVDQLPRDYAEAMALLPAE